MRGEIKIKLLFLTWMIISPVLLSGQKSDEPFPFHNIEYYDSKQGLSGSEIYWATQDKHGFLWFMTDNSLNRFDGYSFRSYSNNFDAKSVSPGQYWGISEDNDGKLWIPVSVKDFIRMILIMKSFINTATRKVILIP
jgi:ligand-binding sensor domain-containing protein